MDRQATDINADTWIYRKGQSCRRLALYARSGSGISALNGNPGQVFYGKASRLPRVPDCIFALHPEERSVTGAQVNMICQQIFPGPGTRIRVSSIKLTHGLDGKLDLADLDARDLMRGCSPKGAESANFQLAMEIMLRNFI